MHSIGSHMLDFIKLTLNHKKTINFITLAHASTSRMFDIRSPNNVKVASLVLFIVAFIDFQNKKHSSQLKTITSSPMFTTTRQIFLYNAGQVVSAKL